jgi:hypothetical protein
MRKKIWDLIGVWAFIIGLVIAIVIAIFQPDTGFTRVTAGILAALGIIVGLLNIGDLEITLFLVLTIALIISANALIVVAQIINLGNIVDTFLQGVIIFVSPAAAIVSLKALYNVAREK